MLEQIGVVKKVDKNMAEIEVRRISGCGGSCKTCSGCDTPGHTLFLSNDIQAEVGDMVKVKGETKHIMKYMFIVYLIPLSTLLIGLFGSTQILKARNVANYEDLSFIFALLGVLLGYMIVRLIDKKIARKNETSISIIEILE